jgi:hypothetical protein
MAGVKPANVWVGGSITVDGDVKLRPIRRIEGLREADEVMLFVQPVTDVAARKHEAPAVKTFRQLDALKGPSPQSLSQRPPS